MNNKCLREKCEKFAKVKGYCTSHYKTYWNKTRKCSVINCQKGCYLLVDDYYCYKHLKEYYPNIFKKYQDKKLERNKNTKARFIRCKSNAKKRSLSFDLSFDYFLQLDKQNCCYCNNLLEKKSLTASSIDRINNTLGYSDNNVLPCCGFCNKTRGDRLTVEETKAIISLILKLRNLIKE